MYENRKFIIIMKLGICMFWFGLNYVYVVYNVYVNVYGM